MKSQPDQARLFGVEAGGFGVEAEGIQALQGLNKLRAFGWGGHQVIFVWHVGDGLEVRRRLAQPPSVGSGFASAAAPSISDTSTNCSTGWLAAEQPSACSLVSGSEARARP